MTDPTGLARKPFLLSPKVQAMVWFAVVLVIGLAMPSANDAPPHPLYYPFIFLLASAAAVRGFRSPYPRDQLPERPIELPSVAMRHALTTGLLFGSIFFLLYFLAWRGTDQALGQGFLFLVLASTARYAYGRKLPHPFRLQGIAAAISIGVYALALHFIRHR